MRFRNTCRRVAAFSILVIVAVVAALAGPACFAQHDPGKPIEQAVRVDPAPVYDPAAPVNWEEAQQAVAHFKVPGELKVGVWAAEPQVINPVAISVDRHGRVWVAETNRYRGGGVLDIRNFYRWVEEDLACRT